MNSTHSAITLDPNADEHIVVVIGRKSRVSTNTVLLPADATNIRLQGVKWAHETKAGWQLLHDDGVVAAFHLWGDEPPYFVNADDFPEDNKPHVLTTILTPTLGTFSKDNS